MFAQTGKKRGKSEYGENLINDKTRENTTIEKQVTSWKRRNKRIEELIGSFEYAILSFRFE